MKAIARQAGLLVMFLGTFYLGLFFLSFLFYPASYKAAIDTRDARRTVFHSDPALLVMNVTNLAASPGRKLFFLGSSNVQEGFRPPELKPFFPEYEIHNLAVGGSNITQLRKIADLLFSALPESSLEGSVFVVGVWYGSFVRNDVLWKNGTTDVEREFFRYKVYRQRDGKPVPLLGWKALPLWSLFLRPVLFAAGAFDNLENVAVPRMQRFLSACIRERRLALSMLRVQQEHDAVGEELKRRSLAHWQEYMGTADVRLFDEQFGELLSLCRALEKKKALVVLVDMPLPRWHCERSPHFSDYQRRKTEFLGRALASPAVSYIDLQDLRQDTDFYDSTHPMPQATELWSRRLGSTRPWKTQAGAGATARTQAPKGRRSPP